MDKLFLDNVVEEIHISDGGEETLRNIAGENIEYILRHLHEWSYGDPRVDFPLPDLAEVIEIDDFRIVIDSVNLHRLVGSGLVMFSDISSIRITFGFFPNYSMDGDAVVTTSYMYVDFCT